MKVQIEDNLFLESDSLSFQIREYNGKTDSKGKELYKTHGYYSTLPSAINGLLKLKIKESTAKTLVDFRSYVLNLEEYIKSKFAETCRDKAI